MRIFFKNSFSKLKNKNISDQEYEGAKFLFKNLDIRNINDIMIYTILLTEILESIASLMQEMYGFNSRQCNSVRSQSSCIQRGKSKVIIALPTSPEIFKKCLKKF